VALFERATAQAVVDHLAHVLRGAAEQPDATVSTLVEPLPVALPRQAAVPADRRALGDGDAAPARHEPPSNADEELLAAIWADVLGVDRVGAGDDFFDRGGQSLLATQVAGRIRQVFGVELPLAAVFEAPVLRDQARRIAALRGGSDAPETTIPRADRAKPLPLSFAQERLWFIGQMLPESAAYNVPMALEMLGPVDVAALERAVGEVVRRHEALRTVIVTAGGGAVQRVQPFTGFHLPFTDLSGLPREKRQDEAQRILDADARAPFVLAEGPVFRARLLRLEAEDHVLSLVIHHVATDLWSGGVLLRELAALYDAFRAGRPSPLSDLPIQYADFAAWQRGWLRGAALERQMEYWSRRLAGAPALLELPADRPRPAVQDLSGTLMPFALPADAMAFARTLARREGATLFMVLMAAFQALLHRWTGETDVVVGTPIANRMRPELEGLIGFFDNTLALRGDLSGDPTFAALLRRVRETTLEAYAHQDVPFEKLVDELKVPRSVSHTPVFQVMLTLQNAPDVDIESRLGQARLRPRVVETATSRFDLTLILAEGDEGGVSGWAEYATALFDEATIRRLTRHLGALLREAASAPHLPISTLSLLSGAERGQVVRAFNATDRPRAPETVHALVAAQAARTPDAAAIEHGGERVTYAELEARARRLAHRLRRLGVGPDVRVAVAMERSVDLVVTTYATLKAGGCCVAVDPGYPPERVAYMLADSRAAVVVTTSEVAARLPALDAAVVRVDAEREAIAAESSDDPGVPVDPENLLYVLYTSGSTGRPKGAALPHRALANLIRWQVERWDEVSARADDLVGARHASPVAAPAPMAADGDDLAAAATGDHVDDDTVRATGSAGRGMPRPYET
ncbi:MAG TPA: condensation domain-containing protein, partial [Longimicrobium sp.]